MTNYLKTLVPIFFITINLLANDFLDSTYSRLEINQGLIADHDFRASTSNYGINYILEDIQMVLAYEITSNKYDEIFGSDFSSLDVEADWTSLGLGFLFKRENVHVIPSLSIGSGNVSLSSMDASNIDYAEVGVKFRVSANDKTIINFNINYVTFGNGKILHDKRNQIISRLENFEHQVSSNLIFNFLEKHQLNNTSFFEIQVDQQLGKYITGHYGLSMKDIFSRATNPNLFLGISLNY